MGNWCSPFYMLPFYLRLYEKQAFIIRWLKAINLHDKRKTKLLKVCRAANRRTVTVYKSAFRQRDLPLSLMTTMAVTSSWLSTYLLFFWCYIYNIVLSSESHNNFSGDSSFGRAGSRPGLALSSDCVTRPAASEALVSFWRPVVTQPAAFGESACVNSGVPQPFSLINITRSDRLQKFLLLFLLKHCFI